ncbi:hypothetical protein [uncultured Campylobacter sp.]|uniref:hypothetical protein n=1 Tax=uncultured Campylobacter sp. TaxID=218934 RepID=UPI0026024CE4|nr:hypothetical protein [uncultured Campylobacter sp.]
MKKIKILKKLLKLEQELNAIDAVLSNVYNAQRSIEAKKKELVAMLGTKPSKSVKKIAKKFKGYKEE